MKTGVESFMKNEMTATRFANVALGQMRGNQDPNIVFLFNTWIRIRANPYPSDRRWLLKKFWSLVLFETWADAVVKIKTATVE